MNWKAVLGIILTLLSTDMLTSTLNLTSATSDLEIQNIDTGEGFATIQEAVDAANQGDTIMVSEGIYHESLVIDRTLTLVGENRNTTIIESSDLGAWTGVSIKADNVSLSGFTIRNSRWPEDQIATAGIDTTEVPFNGIIISNNIIVGFSTGIALLVQNNSVISRNIVINNTNCGIALSCRGGNNAIDTNIVMNNNRCGIVASGDFEYGENTVKDNIVVDHETGIWIMDSDRNTISRNTIADNSWVGIYVFSGDRNTIIENDVRNNGFGKVPDHFSRESAAGIFLGASDNNTIHHNNFVNNTRQASSLVSYNNTWDDGVEGNYWSDYTGEDRDDSSIGDTPYTINAFNQDNHPLMKPWLPLSWWDIHGTSVAIVSVLAVSGVVAALVSFYVKRFRQKLQTKASMI